MAKRLLDSPPSFMWWARDDIELTEPNSTRPSFMSEDISVVSDTVMITLPTGGTTTPLTPTTTNGPPMTLFSGGASPDIRHKIENASPTTARHVAMRMYQSMKKHGLREEATRVVAQDDEEYSTELGRKSESQELLGMEYMLRDGFVNYLRDMVKITPPIPQQVPDWKTHLRDFVSGSGKSTLLEVLAGRAIVSKNVNVQGAVTYNDKHASQICLSRLIAYISGQPNQHIPFLTVRETLEFARDCTQGLRPENFTPQMRKFFAHALVEGQDPFLEYVLEILRLKDLEHKLTGEASDSDRQKLTTAELALGTYSVMLYDQPISGSDLAATYRLVDTIRTVSRIQQSSAVMALTQLSQDVFDLFDRVLLLREGQVLFQGPRQDAIPYFTKLGYAKPSHVDCYEFLEDIAAGNGSQYVPPGASPYTLEDLVDCYRASDHYKDIMRIIASKDVKQTYWLESEPGLGLSLKRPAKYQSSTDRAPRRETELVVTKLSKKVGHSGGIRSTGRVQVGDVVTAISLNKEEMIYLSVGHQKVQKDRTIHVHSILKQTRPRIRLQVEREKEEALVYAVCLYFQAGLSLAGNGVPLFTYLALLFLVAFFGSSLFFFLSALSSIPEVGNALAGLLVSTFLLFSGFVIYPSKIPTYWKWLVHVNPIHWANVSFCRLQFLEGYTDPCSDYLGHLPYCDQFPRMTVGKAYLKFYELSGDTGRPWLPYTILLGWIAMVNFLALLGLKKIEFRGISQSLPHLRRNARVISKYAEDKQEEYGTDTSHSENSTDISTSMHASYSYRTEVSDEVNDISKEEVLVDVRGNMLDIPVKRVTLLFEGLTFTRHNEVTKESVSVFNNITGFVKPQQMVALMGATRACKTTLLKCLAGRVPLIGELKGNLHTSDVRASATFSRLVGYVEHVDAHQPFLTVRESLQFSAALRLGKTIDSLNSRVHVELVLSQLNLITYANQLVGSLRGNTGKTYEIAKKITIAVELVANPSILLLEDPISGLDSAGIWSILNSLSNVADSGRVIIASLTHPNARVLSSFHMALVLTREGHQAYFGPVGHHCQALLGYFKSIPNAPHYSRRVSPISFVMDALGLGMEEASQAPALDYAQIYQSSSLQEINNNEICTIKTSIKGSKLEDIPSNYPAPYSTQALLVLLRTQRFLWRNVQYTFGRLTGCIVIGLLMGSLYYQVEYKDTFGATSRSLYIYMQVILIGVISANNVIPQLGTDRLVYFREKRARMYLPIFYPISWAVGEIPYFLMATFAVMGIGNGMAGIATDSMREFLLYWLVLFIFTLCVTYFGMMITFLAPAPVLAAFVVSIVTSIWVSASGVVVLFSDIRFYKWMYWSNPFQYAMNMMTSLSFYCNTKACNTTGCSCPKFSDGSYVWDRLASIRSLSYERMETDLSILAAMSLLFASLAFILFVVLKHNSLPQ
ncbi:unnamed protein product [Linum tenue]|uniref:ABC transporter domain-containing protein n=1 Tax=Linum tenue TaxID=586396 RepID=A0AAV0R4B2_9ROSI|nr:unnamed protein product [Linum tenue]